VVDDQEDSLHIKLFNKYMRAKTMGQAKRRGAFEQRKEQKLNKQYGLTNFELEEAYRMNRRYDIMKSYNAGPRLIQQLLSFL
jgi:hypothetical protein